MISFEGIFTAMITPFLEDGTIDLNGFRKNIREQLDADVHGLVLFGSTGEGTSLLLEERSLLGRMAIDEVRGQIPLIFGTTHSNTRTAIELSQQAEMLGADALLIAPPYYIKPTQEGIYNHFKAIADSVSIPLILYNNPGRTGVSIGTELLKELSSISNIAAIKDSSGKVEPYLHSPLPVLCGDDILLLSAFSLGCFGIVSILSNLFPKIFVKIYSLCRNNDFHSARKLYQEIGSFVSALSLETNPIVIKKLMEFYEKPAGDPRPPLTSATLTTEGILQSCSEIATLLN